MSGNICEYCGFLVTDEEGFVFCKACQACSHFGKNCSGVSENTWQSKSAVDKNLWKCKNCRVKKAMKPAEDVSEAINTADIRATIEQVIKDTLRKELKIINDKIDSSMKTIAELSKEIINLKTNNDLLQEQNAVLTKRINNIEIQLEQQAQYSRNRNLELVGVPEVVDESTKDIVLKISKVFGMELAATDFISHRLPNKRQDGKSNIIVQFNGRAQRDAFMRECKINKIKLSDIDHKAANTPIYANDNLTPHFRKLLYNTNLFKKQANYFSAYFRGNQIYLKKARDSKPIIIKTFEDIPNL